LVRALGRWTLVALVINAVIGSGIFGLPDDVAREVGAAAPWAYVLAAIGVGAIVLAHAELGSQTRAAGGAYLWARQAFGRHAGIQMGWFVWLTRLTSAAAAANLLVSYLGEFWPAAAGPWGRAALVSLLIGTLTAINIRGVRDGARAANFFTVAKLLPLVLLAVAGLLLAPRIEPPAAQAVPALRNWANAFVLLMFAYGGFETSLIPLAEARDPRRDVPFALLGGLGFVAVLYIALQLVTTWTVPDLAHSGRPLADAARIVLGEWAAKLMAVGAVLSTFGFLCAQLVAVPRLTYAFAEQGDFPAIFARVHPRFRTPYVSIVLWGMLVVALSLYGNFLWNVVLSVASRLVSYVLVCAALLVLRRRQPDADAFRIPAARLAAGIGIAFCLLLVTRMTREHALLIGVVGLVAALNGFAVRQRRVPSG
jgi:amino acid transporter